MDGFENISFHYRKHNPNCKMLDVNSANIRKNNKLQKQKVQHAIVFLEDDKIIQMIENLFRVASTTGSLLQFHDLMSVILIGDDVQGLDKKWNEVHLSVNASRKDDMQGNISRQKTQAKFRRSHRQDSKCRHRQTEMKGLRKKLKNVPSLCAMDDEGEVLQRRSIRLRVRLEQERHFKRQT